MNGNKYATGQILEKLVEALKGRILAGRAQKSPQPCSPPSYPGPTTHALPCRSLAGLAACDQSEPLMGPGRIHGPAALCIWAHGAPW